MAEQGELAFIRALATTLASQPVTYSDDYQQPYSNWLPRVPVLNVDLPPPPKPKAPEPSGPIDALLTLTFKSLKPPVTASLPVPPTDLISSIKSLLADANPSFPPASSQRLLLKGKALADNKLLKEYAVKDGDTITVMASKPTLPPVAPPKPAEEESTPLITIISDKDVKPRGKHGRIPSVVLSPSPSRISPSASMTDINLTLDTSSIPTASDDAGMQGTYREVIKDPEYWQRLKDFLDTQFRTPVDALTAWEDYLRVSKGLLTASEIAKIRDRVGVIGMAGT